MSYGDTCTHIKFKHVTDGFPIQIKTVKNFVISEDFWDTLKVTTQVLQPTLVTLHYCDDMKGDTLTLLHRLLFHNVFMNRWSTFHTPVHSTVFAMDRQFCRRDMDVGVKKDVWSVMEDFSKDPGDKDLNKMKSQYQMFVDTVGSKQVTV